MEIKVPEAGESVAEATVSQILKDTGSFVKTDDEIIELETDKVNQAVYAPADGTLELNVKVDDVVKVGQVIGFIDTEGKGAAPVEPAPPKEEKKPEPKPPEEGPPARVSIDEHLQELETPAPAPSPTPAPALPKTKTEEGSVTRRRMSGLRKTIAQRLIAAKNETAMLTTFNEVDMSEIMSIRAREQEGFVKRNGVKLGFMSFFVKAAVAALKEFPDVNSFIDGDEIATFQTYDVCIAVSTEKGLMVPVIRGCDEMSFGQIEQNIAGFASKAREGKISIDDMRGGSFTITNGGVFGSMLSTPILNPPQSAILGMHTIVKRPVVIKDKIEIRPIMYLALSYDHRIVDGREAIQFLVHMKNNLEEPTRMLIDL
ncbi:MAG: dihydrolipoyllysine-residue succinyltransferase [Simkaniaceae bacterium]|nr:dihydrolipoyllysine-residue succinyltransferase [Candidatus Sacchlamyda saccharinae]